MMGRTGKFRNKRTRKFLRFSQYITNTPCRQEEQSSSALKGNETRFYENYRKEAESYDKDFTDTYNRGLDTVLVFVRPM